MLEDHHFQHCHETLQWHDLGEGDSGKGHLLVALELSDSNKLSLWLNGSVEKTKFVGNMVADEPIAGRALVDKASHVNLMA